VLFEASILVAVMAERRARRADLGTAEHWQAA
jgi:hypothetical protein